MLQARPSAFVHMGIDGGEWGRMMHSLTYDFDDEALPVGANYLVLLVEQLRQHQSTCLW